MYGRNITDTKVAELRDSSEEKDDKPLNGSKEDDVEDIAVKELEKSERVFVCRFCGLVCVYSLKRMALVIQILLFIFTFALWLFGWTMCGIGIWLIVDPKSYEPSRYIDTYNIIQAAYTMIVVGGVLMFLCLLGFVAIITKKSFLLMAYGVILLILFGLQAVIMTLGIFHGFGYALYDFTYREILTELQQYQYNDHSRRFMDFIQIKLRCCGVQSFNDYQKYGMSIPVSCYISDSQFINQQGCALTMRQFLELREGIIGLLSLIAAIIQLIIIALILILLCTKKNDYD